MSNISPISFDIINSSILAIIFLILFKFSFNYMQRQDKIARIRSIATGTRRHSVQRLNDEMRKKKSGFITTIKVAFLDFAARFSEAEATNMRNLFEQAGWSPINAVIMYSLIKTSLTLISGLTALLMINLIPHLIYSSILMKVAILLGSVIIGAQSFNIVLSIMISQRKKLIMKDMSKALDLLAICTTAGLSIDRSFEFVAQEMAHSNVELCKEFAITSIELNILPERQLAFRNLSKRVNVPLVQAISTTLIQAEEQGTSISSTLKILANDFRQQQFLEIEIRAGKLPALLTVPVILFTLPTLLIVILGPTLINLFYETGFK